MMSHPQIVFAYVVLLLASLLGLGLAFEIRRRRFRPDPANDRVFRCERCGFVYTDDPDADRSRCSQCGTMNDAIRF